MKLNWQLLLTLMLLVIGLYLLLANRSNPALTPKQQDGRRTKRYIGIALIISSIIVGMYFYLTGGIKFRASMPNDCTTCKNYVKRHRELRPYHADEYRLLQAHAAACKVCSDRCFDYIKLLEQSPPTEPEERQAYRKDLRLRKHDCADTTKHAILAERELGRLGAKIREGRTRFWAAATEAGAKPSWDPFPKLPE